MKRRNMKRRNMKRRKLSKPFRHKLSKPGVEPFTRREKHMIAITKQNCRDSLLLRLPGELRNKIYEYVLSEDGYKVYNHGSRSKRLLSTRIPNRLALLDVCQQVYEETALLPFTLNAFKFEKLQNLELVRDRLTFPQRRAITRIHIVIRAPFVTLDLSCLNDIHGRNNFSLLTHMPGVRNVEVLRRMPFGSSIFVESGNFAKEEKELKDYLQGGNVGVSVVLKHG